MKQIPIYDATALLVCTIGRDEIVGRIELVERLRTSLAGIERTEHGLLLHFAPTSDLEADLHRFAVDEKRCCAFWGFEVSATASELTLRWDGPPQSDELLDRLLAYFQGEEPITAVTGLL